MFTNFETENNKKSRLYSHSWFKISNCFALCVIESFIFPLKNCFHWKIEITRFIEIRNSLEIMIQGRQPINHVKSIEWHHPDRIPWTPSIIRLRTWQQYRNLSELAQIFSSALRQTSMKKRRRKISMYRQHFVVGDAWHRMMHARGDTRLQFTIEYKIKPSLTYGPVFIVNE